MKVYVSNLVSCATTVDWPWTGFHVLVATEAGDFRRFMATFKYHGAIFRRFGMTISTMIPPCLYQFAKKQGAQTKTMPEIDILFVEGLKKVSVDSVPNADSPEPTPRGNSDG